MLSGRSNKASGGNGSLRLLLVEDQKTIHEQNRRDAASFEGRFANDAWTKAAGKGGTDRDIRGDAIAVTERELTPAQQADLARARRHFADQSQASAQAAAADAARQEARAADKRPIGVPGAAELAERRKSDTFRLLSAGNGTGAAKLPTSSAAASWAPAPGEDGPSADATLPLSAFAQDTDFESGAAPTMDDASGGALSLAAFTSSGETEADAVVENLDYGVQIRMANARLVQALAGFGDKAPMVTGLGGANDVEDVGLSRWLTVDHQVSVQRMAAIA